MARTARSVRTQTRAALTLANAKFSAPKKAFTEIDGVVARVENKETPVHRDEVADFLRFRRGFGYDEALEAVGLEWLKAMVARGYVVQHMPGMVRGGYIVTTKAVETYKLPSTDAEGNVLKFHKAA